MGKTIRWGIMGAGWIADKFTRDLKLVPDAQLYAIGSRTIEKAQDFANVYGAIKAYGSYEQLAADPDVDVIYIATPHILHCENTLMCLNYGKAVLCEKPFAMNEGQVSQMIAKAREKKLFLMEAMWSRFHPSLKKVLELVQSGVIGDIIHVKSDLGFKAAVNPAGRIYNPDLGGGSLLDVGIYPAFITTLLLGEPSEIISKSTLTDRGIDTSMAVTLKYAKGQLASLFSSVVTDTITETDISGTEGWIRMNSKWFIPNSVTLSLNDGFKETFEFECNGNGYEFEVMEVNKCLQNGLTESPDMPLDFSLQLIRLLDAIRKQNGIVYKADL